MDLFQLVAKLGLDTDEYEKGIGKSKGLISNLGSAVSAKAVAIGNLTADLVKKAAGTIVDLGKTGLSYNQQMEDYTTNFRVMLGSTEAAAEKVEELKEMAAHTPFEMGDLADATQTLLSFGIESDKTTGIMQMLGDVSLGNSQRFASLATVFGQVSSTGKLMGQDLLQFINQGFNPLQVIAEKTGASMADLKEAMSGGKTSAEFQKMVKNAQAEVKKLGANASQSAILLSQIGEDGAISAKVVEEAFVLATTEGGQFFKGMEEASKTQSGLISTLKDNWNALLGRVFKPMSNYITSTLLPNAISAVDKLTEAYDQNGLVGMLAAAKDMVFETASSMLDNIKNIKWPTWEDVKSGFLNAWENVKAGASSVMKLVLGETEDGGIKWPTWDQVKSSFSLAWETIKTGAATVMKLILGEAEGGGINWPTWEQVKSAFSAAWDVIKAGASSLMKLVFGETESGGIDWPTWEDVKAAFSAAWDLIKAGASSLMKLVFGETEDGGIDWPTWEEISGAFSNWWNNTFVPNAKAAMVWTLTLFGMPEEDANQIVERVSEWWGGVKESAESALEWALQIPDHPYDSGSELHDKIVSWWNGVKDAAQALLDWVLGIPEMDDKSGAKTKERIRSWWDNRVKPFLAGIMDFVLGALGLPKLSETINNIRTWWNNLWSSVRDHLKLVFSFKLPSVSDIANSIKDWWSSVKSRVGELAISAVAKVSSIFSGGSSSSSSSSKSSTGTSGGRNVTPPAHPGSNAKGLSYVPYDDYLSYLHKGEAVLTAAQAEDWREQRTSGNASVDAQSIGHAVAQAVSQAISGLAVQMDGQTVGHIVAPTVSADIASGARSARRYAVV